MYIGTGFVPSIYFPELTYSFHLAVDMFSPLTHKLDIFYFPPYFPCQTRPRKLIALVLLGIFRVFILVSSLCLLKYYWMSYVHISCYTPSQPPSGVNKYQPALSEKKT